MRKRLSVSILVIGVQAVFCASAVCAQGPGLPAGSSGHDPVIDRALDQIEKSLDEKAGGLITGKQDSGPTVGRAISPVDSTRGFFNEVVQAQEDVSGAAEIEAVQTVPKARPAEGLATKIIPLVHAQAPGILETLDQMKSPVGEIGYDKEDRTLILKDVPGALEAMSAYVKSVDIPLSTQVFELKHIRARDIAGKVGESVSAHIGRMEINERANSITVTDTPSKMVEIDRMIRKADRAGTDVFLDARAVMIILNDEHMAGIDWDAIVSDYQAMAFSGFPGAAKVQKESPLSLGTVSMEDYDILLEALDTVGVVQTVSLESIKVQGGSSVVLNLYAFQLQDLQKPDEGAQEAGADNEPSSDERKDGGIRVHLTLAAGLDKSLTLSISPDYITKDSGLSLAPPGEGAQVAVRDGDTVVIGSLFYEVMVSSAWKIPLLGDIPLLGFVFRNQGQKPRKAEVILFITAKTAENNSKE